MPVASTILETLTDAPLDVVALATSPTENATPLGTLHTRLLVYRRSDQRGLAGVGEV